MLSWFEDISGPGALVLIGALLSAIGAFWGSHQQSRKSDEVSELNKQIAEQQTELKAGVARFQSDNETLRTSLRRVERSVNQLVAEGKITKEEAQAVLNVTLDDLKPTITGEVKPPPRD